MFRHYLYQPSEQQTYLYLIHIDTTNTHSRINLPSRWISLPLPRTLHSRVLIEVFVPSSHIPFSSPEKKMFCFVFWSTSSSISFLFLSILYSSFSSTHSHVQPITDTNTQQTDSHEEFLVFIIVLFFFCLHFFVGKITLIVWIWLAISIDRNSEEIHSNTQNVRNL